MNELQVSGLVKRYGNKAALRGVDLTIRPGEFVTLLGPSGCGKTTTLRCLAGLESPSEGRISMAGRVVVDIDKKVFVPADKRHVGMVFQSYALWPHMTVAENVGYPLKVAGLGRAERRTRVSEVLGAVDLSGYEKRPVTAMSGGQQQRVALARALAARPGIVFYDEPLSNLDTKLRYQMGQKVRSIHDQFETTSIYVTHDQEEAILLSDRIVVMRDGRIVQDGTPEQVYDSPVSSYVADFMGFQNVLPGTVRAAGEGSAELSIDGTDIVVCGGAGVDGSVQVGDRVDVAFRAAHVRTSRSPLTGAGCFSGTVERVTYLGSAINLLVRASGVPMRVRIDLAVMSVDERPRVDDELWFAVNPDRAVVIAKDDATESEYLTTDTAALVVPR